MARAISPDRLASGRPYRSLASSGFGPVFRTGRRFEAAPVLVISAPAAPGPPQVGIVAGRAVGNAVRRNRAKRRLREALRRVELRPGTAYVVVASKEVVAIPFDLLVERLDEAIAGSEEGRT